MALDRAPEPDPRPVAQRHALVHGTGLLLQTAGLVLFLTTCCVCTLSATWEPLVAPGQIIEQHQKAQTATWSAADLVREPARAGMMLTVLFMTVGGLAMLVFGLGMHANKGGSAFGALVTVAMALVVLAAAGTGLWVGQASWWMRIWHLIVSLVLVALAPLTFAAWRQMRADPPPPDQYVVHDDLEPQRSDRRTSAADLAERRAVLEAELRDLERLEAEQKRRRMDRPG